MPKAIKVGVITNAEGAHIDAYLASLARIEEAEEVVLADPSGAIVDMAKKRLGDKLKATFKDSDEMLRQARPQLALITLEAAIAPPAIDRALEAGCHVFTEKPACTKAEDFEKLARKAQRLHRHLMLALANRLHPAVREARRLIKSGALGRLYGVEIHILADQTRLKRENYRKQWYCVKARAGGGHLSWLGIHWLDLTLFMTELKVEQVAGFTGNVGKQPIDIEDSACLALRFDKGIGGTMTSGYYLDKGYQQHIQVWGESGWLRLPHLQEDRLEWYSTVDTKEPKVQEYKAAKGDRGYPPFVRAAVRAAAGLDDAPITPEEGLHVLKTIFAAYRAAQTGKTQGV
jgi:predicted dehydrogenase